MVIQASEFTERMTKAKNTIEGLPGGEMLPSDQDEVIAMLEALRDRKQWVLAHGVPASLAHSMLVSASNWLISHPTRQNNKLPCCPRPRVDFSVLKPQNGCEAGKTSLYLLLSLTA